MKPLGLSPRQQQVAELVSRGLSNREIAEQLGITVGTVKLHVHDIYNKENVALRTELIIKSQFRRPA
jgi:two-component system nitrate/nitrite response regulator NarP